MAQAQKQPRQQTKHVTPKNQSLEHGAGARRLPVNVENRTDSVVVIAQLPGFEPEDVDVTSTAKTVTISTNRPMMTTAIERVQFEIYQGNWYRQVNLPAPVRPDMATVSYTNGELKITLPKVAPAVKIPLNLPGAETFEHKQIPLRTSVDISELAPGPTDTVFKP